MKKRSVIVYVSVMLSFVLVFSRIAYISTSGTYTAANRHGGASISLGTNRGMIYDCNKQPLVNEEYEYYAAVPPDEACINEIEKKYSLSKYQAERLRSGYPAAVKVDADFSSDNIKVYKIPNRYSDDTLAAHIIGYLDSDGKGAYGIEKGYEEELGGAPLKVSFKTDALGRVLSGVSPDVAAEENRGSVTLTIDKRIQKIVETAADRYINLGAVVVIENATGKIKASYSLPNISPKNLEASLERDDSPFINRALTGYSCGSVFKLAVAACALENNVREQYDCRGSIKIGDVCFNCLKEGGHGGVNMESALAYSCNTYFINLGQKLGARRVYKTARLFGFGSPTELCNGITSDSGSLSSLDEMIRNPAALANFSFGQGDIMTTPLQIASAVQCIANGGKLIRPTIIESYTDKSGEEHREKSYAATNVMSKGSADEIMRCMDAAMTYGTGKNAAPDSGRYGGKTATAETGQYVGEDELVQAWFAGYFGENAQYSMAVLAQNGVTGGQSAGPVFREIANEVAKLEAPNDTK